MTTRAWDSRDDLVPYPLLGRVLRRRNRRPGLQAVLWDMDGLLVDTEPVWTVAEEELAARLGGTWSDELKARIVGTRLELAVPTILGWYGVEPTDVVVADTSCWLLERMVELFAERITVLPGVPELLDELARHEVPVALVSSSYRVLVDAVLAHGIGHFAVTVAGDEVRQGKPHPEPYETACRALGVDPRRCVVLEDSPAGIASGHAAGCAVVAVPSVAGVVVDEAPRRLVATSLENVRVEHLRALVRAS
jgi:HAD superfamily hydrolase (TIGR01509 family)